MPDAERGREREREEGGGGLPLPVGERTTARDGIPRVEDGGGDNIWSGRTGKERRQ